MYSRKIAVHLLRFSNNLELFPHKMNKKISVLLVEDHHIMRKALLKMIGDYDNFEVTGEAANGRELFQLLKTRKPDLVLLDIEMPVMNGWEVMEKLRLRYPQQSVIMLSQHYEMETMLHFISKGAKAYLPKNCGEELFIKTLYAVHEKGFYMQDDLEKALMGYKPQRTLTINGNISTRELEVLSEIGNGLTDQQISQKLNITKHTVHTHRNNLLLKTKTHNAAQLTKFAAKNGLI